MDVDNSALLTDLYQLTMVQAFWRESMRETAVYTFFARRLPPTRNFALVCGIADVLDYLEAVRFSPESLEYLATIPGLDPGFIRWLGDFRFAGDVHSVPEGTPVFADEPILEVVAPIAQAQLVETYLMNQLHFQTVVASKAARVVLAAQGRDVVDFGLRRMHGTDAGLKSARAFYVAGVAATSNVLAGREYGVALSGTMGHSYIQAHDSELDAFRAFLRVHPEAILLVDTYDTLRAVRHVVRVAEEMGSDFRARGIRLDSGDLAGLAREARAILDAAGLHHLRIFASGGLDEWSIAELVRSGAPIDGFGVGTAMGVSSDAPSLDVAYKLAEYAGKGRLKMSPGKPILPGRKQVFRTEVDGVAVGDVIARAGDARPGRPLLRPMMRGGSRLSTGREPLANARSRAAHSISALPPALRGLSPADPPFPVSVDPELQRLQGSIVAELTRRPG